MSIVKVSTLIAAATLALSACQANTAKMADPNKKADSISRHAVSPPTTANSTAPQPGGIQDTRISAHDATPDNPSGSTSTSGYTTTNMGRVSSHRVASPAPKMTDKAPMNDKPMTDKAPMTTPGTQPGTMTPGVVSNEPYYQDDKPMMKKK